MKKTTVIAIPSPYVVITTILYALLVPIFFELDYATGEGGKFVVVDNTYNNDNTKSDQTQQMEKEGKSECKSPCPKSSELCITMCDTKKT